MTRHLIVLELDTPDDDGLAAASAHRMAHELRDVMPDVVRDCNLPEVRTVYAAVDDGFGRIARILE